MCNEIWRPISLHSDFYEVSDQGRVCRLTFNPITGSFDRKVFKPHVNLNGYLYFFVYEHSFKSQRYVHSEVATAFCDDSRYAGLGLIHRDGDKKNNLPENLEWVEELEELESSSKEEIWTENINKAYHNFIK